MVLQYVKLRLPDVKVYIWTGYLYEDLLRSTDPKMKMILDMTDYIIDGPYIEGLRNITLPMRGSDNQRIINLKENTYGREDSKVLPALPRYGTNVDHSVNHTSGFWYGNVGTIEYDMETESYIINDFDEAVKLTYDGSKIRFYDYLDNYPEGFDNYATRYNP